MYQKNMHSAHEMAMIPKNRARRRSHGVLIMVNGKRSQMPSMNHTTTVQHMIHATWKLADTVSAKCSQYGGRCGEVLPRVIQDAHVVVHGHEIDEQLRQKCRARC